MATRSASSTTWLLLLLCCVVSTVVSRGSDVDDQSSGASPVCDDNSCLHGNCSDVDGNAVCACEAGWGGNSCDQACRQRSVVEMTRAAEALRRCRYQTVARGAVWVDPEVTNPDPQNCFREANLAFMVYVLEEKTRMCEQEMPSECRGGRSVNDMTNAAEALRRCLAKLESRGVPPPVFDFTNPDPACLQLGTFNHHVALMEVKATICNDVRSQCPAPPSDSEKETVAARLRACQSNLQARGVQYSLPAFSSPDPECIAPGSGDHDFHANRFKLAACLNISYCPEKQVTSRHVMAADRALGNCIRQLGQRSLQFSPQPFVNPDPDCVKGLAAELMKTHDLALQCYDQLPDGECPAPLSVSEFAEFAKQLRECRARVVALTGSEPVFPEYTPFPDCNLSAFNRHARLMEFRVKYCLGQIPEEEPCPQPVSIQTFNNFSRELRECRARVVALTGKEPEFPEFHPNPACELTGFNLHARTMEFRAKFCKGLLQQVPEEEPCPQPVSIQTFNNFSRELRECRARVVALTGKEPEFPEFRPNPACQLTGFNLHARLMEFRAKICNGLLQQAPCPTPVSVSEFQQISSRLRDCRAIYFARTGSEPSFPEFQPDPKCQLTGINLHARMMEFHTRICNGSLNTLPCPPNPSVSQFNAAAAETVSCSERYKLEKGHALSWPVFPDDPHCFSSAWSRHYREFILKTWYCHSRFSK